MSGAHKKGERDLVEVSKVADGFQWSFACGHAEIRARGAVAYQRRGLCKTCRKLPNASSGDLRKRRAETVARYKTKRAEKMEEKR